MIALVLLSSLVLASAPHLLFATESSEWVQLTEEGDVVRRFRTIAGLPVLDAAISPDGQHWAVASVLPSGAHALALFDEFDGTPRILQGPGPVLEHLSFSADGTWVYFVANDLKAQPFKGQPMAYAQVYRVRFAGDPKFQRLSNTPGCHMWPTAIDKGLVIFAHAACITPGRSLAVLDARTGRERELVSIDEKVSESSGTASGLVFYLRASLQGLEMRSLDTRTGKQLSLGMLPPGGTRKRPQWSADGKRVFLSSAKRVIVVDLAGLTQNLVEL